MPGGSALVSLLRLTTSILGATKEGGKKIEKQLHILLFRIYNLIGLYTSYGGINKWDG